jgi:hypothetical protein
MTHVPDGAPERTDKLKKEMARPGITPGEAEKKTETSFLYRAPRPDATTAAPHARQIKVRDCIIAEKPRRPPAAKACRRAPPWLNIGKLRRYVAFCGKHGLSFDRHALARAVAGELAAERGAPFSTRDLIAQCRRCGFEIETDRAQKYRESAITLEAAGHGQTAVDLGRLVDLTCAVRDELKWWTARAIDESNADGRARRARERAAHKRAEADDLAACVAEEAKMQRRRVQQAAWAREKRRHQGRPTQAERTAQAAERRAERAGIARTTAWRRKRRLASLQAAE